MYQQTVLLEQVQVSAQTRADYYAAAAALLAALFHAAQRPQAEVVTQLAGPGVHCVAVCGVQLYQAACVAVLNLVARTAVVAVQQVLAVVAMPVPTCR